MASVPKNDKRQTGVNVRAHLELIFDLARVGLWVQPADVVVNGSELTHWYGCVSTQTSFQDGIVNKHILLLHQSKMSSGVKISFTEIQNSGLCKQTVLNLPVALGLDQGPASQ